MKKFYNTIVFCALVVLNTLQAQITIHTSASCSNPCSGSIEINISSNFIIENEFEFPFELTIINLTEETSMDYEIFSNNFMVSDLCGGDYEVVIYFDDACFYEDVVQIHSFPPMLITGEVSHNCSMRNPVGAIDINVEGGTGPFEVQWIRVALDPVFIVNMILNKAIDNFESGEQNISGMPHGMYIVIIRDANGCGATATFAIENTPISITFPDADPICFLGEGGSLLPTLQNAEEPLDVKWEMNIPLFGRRIIKQVQDVTHLDIGIEAYNSLPLIFYVTDRRGCSASYIFIAELRDVPIENSHIIVSATAQDLCMPETGSIIFSALGGVAPYTFKLNNIDITSPVEQLDLGYYEIIAEDAERCRGIKEVEIKTKELEIVITASEICRPGDIATLTVSSPNASLPISVQWSTGATTSSITAQGGHYQVTVTDTEGCTAEGSIEIRETLFINEDYVDLQTDEQYNVHFHSRVIHSCPGLNNGTIRLPASRPFATYEHWIHNDMPVSLSGSNHVKNNLAPGMYCLIRTHSDEPLLQENGYLPVEGCYYRVCFEVKELEFVNSNNTVVQPTCDQPGGTIGVDPNLLPGVNDSRYSVDYYTFLWSDGSTERERTDLSPGTYTVTITFANMKSSCNSFVQTYEIQDVADFTIEGTVINGLQGGNMPAPTGQILIDVIGGSGDFEYFWLFQGFLISESKDLNNCASGTYTVVVRDVVNNCYESSSFIVTNQSCIKRSFQSGVTYRKDRTMIPFMPCPHDRRFGMCTPGNCSLPFVVAVNPNNLDYPVNVKFEHPDLDPYPSELTFYSREEMEGANNYATSPLVFMLKPHLAPYTLKVTDYCNNTDRYPLEVWPCKTCKAITYNNTASHHTPGEGSMPIVFEINGLCKKLSKQNIKVKNTNTGYVDGEEYRIIWPDGSIRIQKKRGSTGPDRFKLPDASYQNRPLKIEVIRSDGCRLDFEVVFYGEREYVVFTHPTERGERTFRQNGIGKECGNINKRYLAGTVGTAVVRDPEVMFFRPNLPDLNTREGICNSGGTVDLLIDNGVNIRLQTINVPPNICIATSNNLDPAGYVINQNSGGNLICTRGGSCIFDARDLIPDIDQNIELDLAFCSQVRWNSTEGDQECPIVNNMSFNFQTNTVVLNVYIGTVLNNPNTHQAAGCTVLYRFERFDDQTDTWLPHGMNFIMPWNQISFGQNFNFNHNNAVPSFVSGQTYRVIVWVANNNGTMCCSDFTSEPLIIRDYICPSLISTTLLTNRQIRATVAINDPINNNNFVLDLTRNADNSGWVREGQDILPAMPMNSLYSNTFNIPTTQNGIYRIEFEDLSGACPSVFSRQFFFGPAFRDDCDSSSTALIYNDDTDLFYIIDQKEDLVKISEFDHENKYENSYILNTSDIQDFKIMDFVITEQEDYIILGNDSLNNQNMIMLSKEGELKWAKELTNLHIASLNKVSGLPMSIIAYNNDSLRWEEIIIYDSGLLITSALFTLPDIKFEKVVKFNGGVIALDTVANKLLHYSGGQIKDIALDQRFVPKDISRIDENEFIVASEFKGLIELGQKHYNSYDYNNIIISKYDNLGTIKYHRPILADRHERLLGIVARDSNIISYHGIFEELVYEGQIPEENIKDTCSFFDVVDISVQCVSNTPDYYIDTLNCSVALLNSESFSYMTILKFENGFWREHVLTTEEFTSLDKGRYRLYTETFGCEPSDYVEFTIDCVQDVLNCHTQYFDLQYDSLIYQYVYSVGEMMDSTPYVRTYTIHTDLVPGSIQEIAYHQIDWHTITHVRYDSNMTFYYFGTDSISRSFVTIVDTAGGQFTTWYNDMVIYSVNSLSQSGRWNIIAYKVSEEKYYSYSYFKGTLSNGSLIIESPGPRGDLYDRIWILSATNYMTYQRSGTIGVYKIYNEAQAPVTVNIPVNVHISNVHLWQGGTWMLSGSITGTVVLNGIDYGTNGVTTGIYIWVNSIGVITKVKLITGTDDIIIHHVATDGVSHVSYTYTYQDSLWISPDSMTYNVCSSMSGFDTEFPQGFARIVGSVSDVIPSENPGEEIMYKIYPNPFSDIVNIEINTLKEQEINLIITNTLGEQLYQQRLYGLPGKEVYSFNNFESLPAGVYYVLIHAGSSRHTVKLIKIQ